MKRSALTRKTAMNRGISQLKRSPFVKPSMRAGGSVKTLKVWGYKKVPPTVEESEWMDFVAGYGCVVCWLFHNVKTPCAVHHIIEGGRRRGHFWTIGLCDPGHHQNAPTEIDKISRHPWKKRFEAKYGTEYELHTHLVEQYKFQMGREIPCH
jgi:hypothetical protein